MDSHPELKYYFSYDPLCIISILQKSELVIQALEYVGILHTIVIENINLNTAAITFYTYSSKFILNNACLV